MPLVNGNAVPAVVFPVRSGVMAKTIAAITATKLVARTSPARRLSSCAITVAACRPRGNAIRRMIAETVRTKAIFAQKKHALTSK